MDKSQHPALQEGLGTVRATPAGLFSKEKRTETPFGGLGASLQIVEDQAKCLEVGNLERVEANCSRGAPGQDGAEQGRAPSPWGRTSAIPRPVMGSRQGIFSFAVCTFGVMSKNSLQIQCQENFPLCFLLIVLYFGVFDPLELILVYGIKRRRF